MAEPTYFDKRKMQMEYVVPLVQDLIEILGKEVVHKALQERNQRSFERVRPGSNADFSRMAEGTKVFAAGDALAYEVIAKSETAFDMNVTECQYAEMMKELGGDEFSQEFGPLLICNGDFAAAKKIGMTLNRTQTRMQGNDFCDFRYSPVSDEHTSSERDEP